MKIAAVSLIKDEADIIELFVRVNSSWADHFFIVDNGSTDYTPHILRRLSEEGFGITVVHDGSVHYQQSRMTTKMVGQAAKSGPYDFVFPIDGDEFVSDSEAFKHELASLPSGKLAALEWMTLVPKDGAVMSRAAPLFNGFEKRSTELRRVCKVVLPGELAKVATVSMGNHGALGADGKNIEQVLLRTPLAHVPVRSKEQIIVKTLVGSHKMSIKEDRKPGEVFHWDLIADFLRANGFVVSDEQLRDIALGYGWSKGDPKVRETVPVSIGVQSNTMRYPELAKLCVPRAIDGFLGLLCEEIRVQRSTASLAKRALRQVIRRF
jgi:glycosyltransferase involved in cell wall biosynthesis